MSNVSGFGKLPQDMVHIAGRGSSLVGARLYSNTNGLREMINGEAPGGGQVFLNPHDHGGDDGKGGTPLARNNVFSYDCGDIDGCKWDIGPVGANAWYRKDRNGQTVYGNAEEITAKGIPGIVAEASPGVDTEKANVSSSPCGWEARVLIYNDQLGGATTQVRFKNRTTKSYSSIQSTTAVGQVAWLEFDDIPVKGGQVNELDLEIMCNANVDRVFILNVTISETRRSSQPESAGLHRYDQAPKP